VGFLVVMGVLGVASILFGLRPGPWEVDHLEIEVGQPRPPVIRPRVRQAAETVIRLATAVGQVFYRHADVAVDTPAASGDPLYS
jgi:hypothetical protein